MGLFPKYKSLASLFAIRMDCIRCLFLLYCFQDKLLKKIRINNQITSLEVRTIGPSGENLGVMQTADALARAKELELDLIELVASATPPVVKIMDYGKWQYEEQKKIRKATSKVKETGIRGVRVNLGTGDHDLQMKAKKISEFLKDGDRVKIDMVLRGREKYLDSAFLGERLKRILKFVTEEYKVAQESKKAPRGINIIIEKKK